MDNLNAYSIALVGAGFAVVHFSKPLLKRSLNKNGSDESELATLPESETKQRNFLADSAAKKIRIQGDLSHNSDLLHKAYNQIVDESPSESGGAPHANTIVIPEATKGKTNPKRVKVFSTDNSVLDHLQFIKEKAKPAPIAASADKENNAAEAIDNYPYNEALLVPAALVVLLAGLLLLFVSVMIHITLRVKNASNMDKTAEETREKLEDFCTIGTDDKECTKILKQSDCADTTESATDENRSSTDDSEIDIIDEAQSECSDQTDICNIVESISALDQTISDSVFDDLSSAKDVSIVEEIEIDDSENGAPIACSTRLRGESTASLDELKKNSNHNLISTDSYYNAAKTAYSTLNHIPGINVATGFLENAVEAALSMKPNKVKDENGSSMKTVVVDKPNTSTLSNFDGAREEKKEAVMTETADTIKTLEKRESKNIINHGIDGVVGVFGVVGGFFNQNEKKMEKQKENEEPVEIVAAATEESLWD